MKLLLDHNLSHRLVHRLADIFPDSTQTKLLGFNRSADTFIWEHARANGFAVVTLDKDFADLSFFRGAPPKVIADGRAPARARPPCEARGFHRVPERLAGCPAAAGG